MTRILVVGATSAIATETARRFAQAGAALFLVGRDIRKLEAVRDDLLVRGASRVATFQLDAEDLPRHEDMWHAAVTAFDGLDAVLVAQGMLPDQRHCERHAADTVRALTVNFTSVACILTHAAEYFAAARRGCIAAVSSVAGDRGRQSNYVYGSAKGGLTTFLSGLRNRLYPAGVAVITVKPGFVDTPMTQHLPRTRLFTSPAVVGDAIYQAMRGRGGTVYVPWFWRWIMLVITHLPEPLFKRLRL